MSLRASVEHQTFSSSFSSNELLCYAKNYKYPFSVLARVRVYFVVTYHNVCVSELGINLPVPVFLLHVTLCLHFVAARDAETLRARQQQQANTVAVAEAALQAQHEETTRQAGEFEGGSRTQKNTALAC